MSKEDRDDDKSLPPDKKQLIGTSKANLLAYLRPCYVIEPATTAIRTGETKIVTFTQYS